MATPDTPHTPADAPPTPAGPSAPPYGPAAETQPVHASVLDADPAVLAELKALRDRLPDLTGSLVTSADGLLIAHDLPASIEPAGAAALSAAELSLSRRMASLAGEGAFREVVVSSADGHAVIYQSGPTASLTVLAKAGANVGRLHLEARLIARRIAEHLAIAPGGSRPVSPRFTAPDRKEHR